MTKAANDAAQEQLLQLFNYRHTSVINTMKPSTQTSELMSALADGQLQGDEFAQALQTCQLDASALPCWNTYHLIGDVLRAPAAEAFPASIGNELAFLARLNLCIAQEPSLQISGEAHQTAVTGAALETPTALSQLRGQAANDGNFRWKLVAGFASLAAVSAIAWSASGLGMPTTSPQLAQAAPVQILVGSPQGPVVRDAGLEELLAAHRQFGARSVLQEPSGFLRNAAFGLPQEARR